MGNAGITGFKPQMRPASLSDFSKTAPEFEGNPALAREAHDLYRQQRWGGLEELSNKNGINGGYPPNNGAIGTRTTTLHPGSRIDRYGGFFDESGNFVDKGQYLSPENSSFGSRALQESALNKPYRAYEVIKPIPGVQEGNVIPWYGQPGRGIQYQLPGTTTIQDLIDGGFIRGIN